MLTINAIKPGSRVWILDEGASVWEMPTLYRGTVQEVRYDKKKNITYVVFVHWGYWPRTTPETTFLSKDAAQKALATAQTIYRKRLETLRGC